MATQATEKVVKTFCGRMCAGACGILVTVKNGKAVKVVGDPDCPTNKGTLCPKGASLLKIVYHQDRLKFPQKRVGARGEGKWQTISWDEALGIAAQRLSEIKEKYGPRSLAIATGHPKGLELTMSQRFATAFGTPNVCSPGAICHMPRVLGAQFTHGSPTHPDYEHPPKCLMVWGSNMIHTNEGAVTRATVNPILKQGTKLIVVDPHDIDLTKQADIWLRLRPASDGFLAMGMLKVIVDEKLYDQQFVSQWTVGFDKLVEALNGYTLNQIEDATWVPASQIAEAARLFANTRPAAIQWGNAIDQMIDSFQVCRILSILRAVTGNLDIPGGEAMPTPAPVLRPAEFMLLTTLGRDQSKMVGAEFKLAAKNLFAPRQSLVKAILEEKPYAVKALMTFAVNALLTFPNSHETYRALQKLDFLVTSELFMTPSAQLADLVLPAAMNLEFNDLGSYGVGGRLVPRSKVIEPPGEAWSDIKIMNELAKKLGFGQHFWPDVDSAWDTVLQPSGLTPEAVRAMGFFEGKGHGYKKYEKGGFRTPSTKVEIYSQQLKDMGYDPFPVFHQPPQSSAEYPLILTNGKPQVFFHSSLRNVPSLRKMSPEPEVEMHPDVAVPLGIQDGDMVYLETVTGRIKQKAALNPKLDKRTIVAAADWWFPEGEASSLYAWDEANLNVLSPSGPPYDPVVGAVPLRGVPCRVFKAG